MRYLIEPKEVLNDGVKRCSPFREPVPSESIIAPFISVAMSEYVVPVLGHELYDAMVIAKGERVSVYNPSERLGEVLVEGFDDEVYEALWTKGGVRELCGWAVSLVACTSLGTEVSQGGLSKFKGGMSEGGANIDDERRLLQSWERCVEVLSKKVSEYISRGEGFGMYKIESSKENIIREVGILKIDLPKW